MCRRSSAASRPSCRARHVGRHRARLADRLSGGEPSELRRAPHARSGDLVLAIARRVRARCRSAVPCRRCSPATRDDVVGAVLPANPRLMAAVVVVAEQHERRGPRRKPCTVRCPGGRGHARCARTRCAPLVGHGLGSVCPGWMRVGRWQCQQRVHDRGHEVRIGRASGRVDPADRSLEQGVAGEDDRCRRSATPPSRRCVRACGSASISSAAAADRHTGRERAGRAGNLVAFERMDQHRRVRMARGHGSSSQTWS